ncbi:MAG: AroM family protein [Firmicutes bacterium]|nr:AroM family protein [Bacillota bacterium]
MVVKRVLGTLTIGQSPRVDLIPEMKDILGGNVEVLEAGALDGLTLEEVQGLYPGPDDYVLVTRMADGTSVKIAERHILPRMQERIDGLVARGAEIIALVCTGEFPPFHCDRLIVRPQRVLHNTTAAVAGGLNLGVLLPDADQIPQGTRRWTGAASAVRIEPASPYGPVEAIGRAAANLREWGAQLVVMDCIGYTLAMKDTVREITGVPVVLARSIVARVVAELL